MLLTQFDLNLDKAQREVARCLHVGTTSLGPLTQTPRARQVIKYAVHEARTLKHQKVGTEHLLLGLLRER